MDKQATKPFQWPQKTYILIPAYNAAHQLDQLLASLLLLTNNQSICVVDDGSSDNTPNVCSCFKVKCLIQERNYGKGAALKIGFRYLLDKGALWILTMDADGQHAVEDIIQFIGAARKFSHAGIICGARTLKPSYMPLARVFSNRVTSLFLSWLCRKKIDDSQCGYRLYSSDLLEKIPIEYNRFEMESEIILKACFSNFEILFVPVKTLYCSEKSHISHIKDMYRWIRAVIAVWIKIHLK